MLSRVASSLFWLSRNIERAENNARVLEARLINALESSDQSAVADSDWEAVLDICSSVEEYRETYDDYIAETVAHFLIFDRNNINSIINCMEYARNNARSVRDIIPEEMWEVINGHYLQMMESDPASWSIRKTYNFLKEIKILSFTLQGVIESSMLREEAYSFLKIGKWLERGEKTARVLNVVCEKTKEAQEEVQAQYYYWLSALQFLNGYDAYLKRFPPTMDPSQVLPFLISYEQFPRSIEYCVEHIREAVMKIEGGKVSHYSAELFDALDEVTREFTKIKFQEMTSDEMVPFLDNFQNSCNRIGYVFAKTYYFI
ncbi:alpha-E domain-containing protein [Paenalkalicoccus suaedae]|uniref:Alpha-E domain-containing protein n=1 Tax=Paenalkalicoccus suaedae TaxID=2592382 RepID=A0A859FID8_9BACI|nr:alpha-E domain-containing protein [Paenalkalicoccus suaedae]QKS72881.1 alpha-E domain-containing protein [Paenalkalicoccus suaedae]